MFLISSTMHCGFSPSGAANERSSPEGRLIFNCAVFVIPPCGRFQSSTFFPIASQTHQCIWERTLPSRLDTLTFTNDVTPPTAHVPSARISILAALVAWWTSASATTNAIAMFVLLDIAAKIISKFPPSVRREKRESTQEFLTCGLAMRAPEYGIIRDAVTNPTHGMGIAK